MADTPMKRTTLATDPGASGATAIQWADGEVSVHAWKGPSDFKEVVQTILEGSMDDDANPIWVLEDPPKTTGMKRPEATGFVLGHAFGFIHGYVMAMGFALELVKPKGWQQGIVGIPRGKKLYPARKKFFKEVAARYFPQTKVTQKNADSLLILQWRTERYTNGYIK